MRLATKICGTSLLLLFFACQQKAPLSFNQDIRPILNEKCLSCHGGVRQKGDLSLRFRSEALNTNADGQAAIVPGAPEQSLLIHRIRHTDVDERMPLHEEALSETEIQHLHDWIRAGAPWEDHWAFLPISKPQANSKSLSWGNNPIDFYVGKHLKAQGFKAAPEADRATLLRRVSLDLTGLPPNPESVQAFVQDNSPDAYEKQIDRLLASSQYGERWAALWMDLARYGDSQGYQKDLFRSIWRYRDWLIKAFNQDMPFDQFTIEQLAGDLLPNPDIDQMIATAFHRNTMTNDEGGTDDEEFRVAAVLDRVNTTMEIWQGMTISCVQCHDHPYDPFQQEEYYQLYAFFNNSQDHDRTNDFPRLKDWLSSTEIADKEQWLDSLGEDRTPVMLELPIDSSRTTQLFERGNWLVHGDTVYPNVPEILPEFPEHLSPDRLGLAKWLVDPQNPLTTRVIVNRFWEQLFGIGLVASLEDFGTQGEKPSHPELLDYLAWTFQHDLNWSVKKLLKHIVMSATYRQSSFADQKQREIDPYNIHLARGPRVRLSAEQLRDQALKVSGLLNEKMYGPSVMPPQPEGTWQVIRHALRWEPSKGPDRYRRALYTFWRKSSPFPSMTTFDSPSREFCVSRRIRTNTPLQALVTLNDSTFYEAAVSLAGIMSADNGLDAEQQIQRGFEQALFHPPDKPSSQHLIEFYHQSKAYFETHPEALNELQMSQLKRNAHHAALIQVANVILNLDEFITKS